MLDYKEAGCQPIWGGNSLHKVYDMQTQPSTSAPAENEALTVPGMPTHPSLAHKSAQLVAKCCGEKEFNIKKRFAATQFPEL